MSVPNQPSDFPVDPSYSVGSGQPSVNDAQTVNFNTPVHSTKPLSHEDNVSPIENVSQPRVNSPEFSDTTAKIGEIGSGFCRGQEAVPSAFQGTETPRTDEWLSERYEERGELGRGGWGVVDRAYDRQLGREVAIKRIVVPDQISTEAQERFLHEAKITSQLQHPGVVPVHELNTGANNRNAYYVMKLLEGDTLRNHIRQAHSRSATTNSSRSQRRNHRPSSHQLMERISPLLERFIDVCHAIAYAHEQGVVHRDLKPSNIVVGAFGETIVVDWGLARKDQEICDATVVGGTPDSSKSNAYSMETDGSILGTPAYMSPEQARGKLSDIDHRSDIYSLGIILFEIVAGQHPYRNRDIGDIIEDVTCGTRRCIQELQPTVPKPLLSIINKATQPSTEERYGSASVLASDVRRLMLGDPVSVYRDSWLDKTSRWCRRNRSAAVSISIAVAILLIASFIFGAILHRSRQIEHAARLNAQKAHRVAFDHLVKARDAADTWLIDLSGSLEFYPGLEPLRARLVDDAIKQYERIVKSDSINGDLPKPDSQVANELKSSNQNPAAVKTIELPVEMRTRLEYARCHLRLGDLYRMTQNNQQSKIHFRRAGDILNVLIQKCDRLNQFDASAVPTVAKLKNSIQLERANASMGLAFHDPGLISGAAFQTHRKWLRFMVPNEEEILTHDGRPNGDVDEFLCKTASAAVRLELVAYRANTTELPPEITTSRLNHAANIALWLANTRSQSPDRRLFQTTQQSLAEFLTESDQYDEAYEAWTRLISKLTDWNLISAPRPDQLQAMSHARLVRLSLPKTKFTREQKKAEYGIAIRELNQAWSLSDADSFYRTNLATAEFNLGNLMTNSESTNPNPQELERALALLQRSLATYQELLRESPTADRLRRLAGTHLALLDVWRQIQPSNSQYTPSEVNAQQLKHFSSASLSYQMLRDHEQLTTNDAINWYRLLVSSQPKLKTIDNRQKTQQADSLSRWLNEQILSPEQQSQLNALRNKNHRITE